MCVSPVVAVQGLSCSGMGDLSGPGVELMSPPLQGTVLNHWTTREALKLHFKRFTLVAVAEEVGETFYHLFFSVCV